MFKGESISKRRTVKSFKAVGVLIPVYMVILNLLVHFGIIKTSSSIGNYAFILFSFWWLLVGILQFFIKTYTKFILKLIFICYHLLFGAFLIFVVGISSPFIVIWILFSIASFLFISIRGFFYSFLFFIGFIALDVVIHENSVQILIADLLTLTMVIIVTSTITAVINFIHTDKKALDDSKAHELLQRNRILTIINNLADAVLSTDSNGVIVIYNAACLNLLNTNISLNGKNINEIFPLVDQDGKKINLFDEFEKSKTVTVRDDLDYFFNDNDKMRLEITFSSIRSNFTEQKRQNRDGYVAIIRDITKEKDLEEERDEFISVVSHELRTPITIAEGTISNVQVMMGHPDVTDSMLKDSVDLAHKQIVFLAGMVNDLSTLSRAERGVADSAEIIDIKELAHNLHNKYYPEAQEKGLQFNLDIEPRIGYVNTSRLYLEEMLQNFITNSIKYTKKGGVTLTFSKKNEKIIFSIKDTGIGISKSDQQKIFHKFYRSEDYRTRETSGTGLGLYIAAKLAYKIGAKIKLTSRLNYGSTFSFSLPEFKKK